MCVLCCPREIREITDAGGHSKRTCKSPAWLVCHHGGQRGTKDIGVGPGGKKPFDEKWVSLCKSRRPGPGLRRWAPAYEPASLGSFNQEVWVRTCQHQEVIPDQRKAKMEAEGEALRIRHWKQIGDQIRSTQRTATLEFLLLRIISTATEAAAFGFVEDGEPPKRKPEAPELPGHCF